MHVVHGTLRKEPMIKQLQESTMFILELSEMVKDFKTGEKTYTNYKAMLFAKSQAAIDYYTQATTLGSFVVLNCEKLKVETFDANSGKTYITLMMDNAKLEGAQFNQASQPQQAPQQQQYNQAPQQQRAPQQQQQAKSWCNAPQQAPTQYADPNNGFDNDVPF